MGFTETAQLVIQLHPLKGGVLTAHTRTETLHFFQKAPQGGFFPSHCLVGFVETPENDLFLDTVMSHL